MNALLVMLTVAAQMTTQTPPATAPTATAPTAAKQPTLRLAVYELKSQPGDERLAELATDAVVVELRKLQRVSVVSMDEVRAMLDLESQKQLLGCGDDSCVAEIADSLGVDGVIIGSIAHLEAQTVFGLRRIDQRDAKTVGQVTERLTSENGEEVLAAVGPFVQKLFPEFPLRAGAVRGVSPEIALLLNPPPLPKPVFYVVAGAAAVTGLAAVGAAAVNSVLIGQVTAQQKTALNQPVDGASFVDLRAASDGWATAAVVLAASAGVLAVSAGGVALFTDWRSE